MIMRQLSDISEQEEKMMETPSYLSADAPPFCPGATYPIEIAIYNNGVPSMMLVSEEDIYNVLHGIEDILKTYPPDATDAAELELADDFVEAMAMMDFLEELEERARTGDFVFFTKRWEARRAEGLKGRPHPPKHWVDPVIHLTGSATSKNQDVKALVKKLPSPANDKYLTRENNRQINKKMGMQYHNHHTRGIPIYQPRKQNY
jgi:hypothetical protein